MKFILLGVGLISKSYLKIRWQLSNLKEQFILLLSWSFLLIPSIFWDFDRTHETVLLNSVIAAQEGYSLHGEIFEPKGILYPLVLAFFEGIFNDYFSVAVYSRLLQYILVGVTAFGAWIILRTFSSKLRLAIPVFWLIGNQYWTHSNWSLHRVFFLEPNYLVAFLIVVFLVLISTLLLKNINSMNTNILTFTAASIIGMLPWVRIQGLIFILLLFPYLLLVCRKRGISKFPSIAGTLFSFTLPFVYLLQRESLADWFRQIIWHPVMYTFQGSRHSTMPVGDLIPTLVTFLTSALFIAIFCFGIGVDAKGKFARVGISAGATLLLALVFYFAVESQVQTNLNNNPLNWLVILAEYFPQLLPRLALVVLYLVLFYSIKKPSWLLKDSKLSDESSLFLRILMACSIGSSIYLYPNIGHTFTLSLPSLITLSLFLSSRLGFFSQNLKRRMEVGVIRMVVSLATMTALFFVSSAQDERFKFTSEFLLGTYPSQKDDAVHPMVFEAAANSVGSKTTAVFCNGEVVFNSRGKLILNTPYFGLGDNMKFTGIQESFPNNIFVCAGIESYGNPLNLIRDLGFTVKDFYLKEKMQLDSGTKLYIFKRLT